MKIIQPFLLSSTFGCHITFLHEEVKYKVACWEVVTGVAEMASKVQLCSLPYFPFGWIRQMVEGVLKQATVSLQTHFCLVSRVTLSLTLTALPP